MADTWALITQERRVLADLTDTLDEAQLATQSLCDAWTVHDVIAHLTLSLQASYARTFGAFVRSGFRFPKAVELLTAEAAKQSPAELAALLRDRAETQWNPPGFGPQAPLTDLLVHGVDLRQPIGLTHDPDPAALLVGLDFAVQRKAGAGFTKSSCQRGLRFEATDVDWSHGDGPVVRGPAQPLLAALCSRAAVLEDLTGDGIAVLRDRLG